MEAEEFFKESVAALRENSLITYKNQPPNHTFSSDFEKQMQDLIARQRRKELRVHAGRLWRQAACFVFATAIGLGGCFVGVAAWSNNFLSMIVEDHTTYSSIHFAQTGQGVPQTSSVQYTLTAVPDGFRRVSHGNSPDGFLNYIDYENDKGQYIRFQQNFAESIGMAVNTEGAKLEELEFRGHPARFLENKGWYFLLWYDDKYTYQVDTNLSREETFRLGEQVKLRSMPYPSSQQLPIESVPEQYDLRLARENGDVILSGNQVENLPKLTAFVEASSQKKDGALRIAVSAPDGSLLIYDLQMKNGHLYYTADEHHWKDSEQPWEIGEEYDSVGIFMNGTTHIVLLYSTKYDTPKEVVRYQVSPQ